MRPPRGRVDGPTGCPERASFSNRTSRHARPASSRLHIARPARGPPARRRRCRRRPAPTSSARRRPRRRPAAPRPAAPACGWNSPPCTGANASPTSRWRRVSAAPNSARSCSASAGQQRGQHELGDQRRRLGGRAQAGERLPPRPRPDRPGSAAGGEHAAPLLGHRRGARAAARARSSPGARRPRPRSRRGRTSTGPPPSARRGRRRGRSRAGRGSGRPARQRPVDRERELGARAEPDVRAGSPPDAQPRRGREAEGVAAAPARRPARARRPGPRPSSSSAGVASTTSTAGARRRPRGRRTAARPPPATSSMPRCSRAGASTRTRHAPPIARARRRELHRLALARPGGLVDQHLQARQLGADLLGRQPAHARGEDRGLEHGVAGAVEAEELAPAAAAPPRASRTRARGRVVVDRLDADLAPRAGVGEHGAVDRVRRRGSGGCGSPSAACANSRMSSVRLTTAAPVGAQVAQRARRAVRLDRRSSSSPHSTPIAAQLTVPSGLSVVVTVSTIIPRTTGRGRRGRRRRRGSCVRWRVLTSRTSAGLKSSGSIS